ncbi:MAG: hypothetical protein V7750_00760 [Sneathiella sp.]
MGTDTSETAEPAPVATPVGEAPAKAGKLIIPDLTPMTVGQGENIAAMTAITKSASESLQKIVAEQQTMLKTALTNLQTSVEESSGRAGIGSKSVPDLQASIDNLKLSVENFSATAETITATNAASAKALTESANKSFDKIVETAEKFSGG